MDRKTFDAKRAVARKSTGELKTIFQELANAALAHGYAHGDTSYIADLYSDMRDYGKNFIRSVSYAKWVVAMSPFELKDGKWVKNKEREAEVWATAELKAALLKKAEGITFWDFDPEATIVNFDASKVIEGLEALVKRFENSKHYKAANAEAMEVVSRVKNFVGLLKAPANVDAAPVEQPTEEPVVAESTAEETVSEVTEAKAA